MPRRKPSPELTSTAGELSRDMLTATATSGTTSPERSEDSFDLVSSGHTSATGDSGATHPHVKEASDGDDDGEDDDEDSAESDWE